MFPKYDANKPIPSEEDMAAYDSLMVFTGNANPKLAANVVKHLDISIGNASVSKFSDGLRLLFADNGQTDSDTGRHQNNKLWQA